MELHQCSRTGCTTIACHRHSEKHGYICSYCFNELVKLRKVTREQLSKVFKRFDLVKHIKGEGYHYD